MVEFTLIYQIFVLVFLGANLIFQVLSLRRNMAANSIETRFSNGDTNVNMQARLAAPVIPPVIPPPTPFAVSNLPRN